MRKAFPVLTAPISEIKKISDISIAFEVKTIFEVQPIDHGLDGLNLVEVPVEKPYTKDYDTEEPLIRWQQKWDLSNWGLFFALDGEQRIGSALIAWRTEGVNMLQERDDLAVLWDFRVRPGNRGKGVGRALFSAAADWAQARKCTEMIIETQNINVPACRFYAAMGSELWSINRFAYPDMPEEIQLLWRFPLDRSI